MNIKLGILTTHPIQYQVPWFRGLAQEPEIDLTVFFCMIPDAKLQGDGFGVSFNWDVPLLEGYRYKVLENKASKPGVSSFGGCDTPGIHEIVRNGGFDAFIVNGWVVKSCLQLLHACNRYKVPCIVRGESNNLRPRSWWKKLIHRILLRRYSAFLYIGEGNKRFYLKNGVPKEKLFFAPYCIDNDFFAANADKLRHMRNELKDDWGIPHAAVTYLFCGKFIEKKRPMDCLQALEKLQQKMHDSGKIHLLMVGTGELLEKCRQYARDNDLPVTFAGFLNQSEIAKAYVTSDCQVLPSDNGETWGLVINEGMACGLPAIVSDQVGCYLDLIHSGETGDIYKSGEVNALAEMMFKYADANMLQSMGKNAREKVSTYSYQQVVRGTLDAFWYLYG